MLCHCNSFPHLICLLFSLQIRLQGTTWLWGSFSNRYFCVQDYTVPYVFEKALDVLHVRGIRRLGFAFTTLRLFRLAHTCVQVHTVVPTKVTLSNLSAIFINRKPISRTLVLLKFQSNETTAASNPSRKYQLLVEHHFQNEVVSPRNSVWKC